MVRSIDHIVIAVRDLAESSADYVRAGFTVTPGGEHVDGATHNALIAFEDGSYFELIAFKHPDQPQEHRWWALLNAGEGLVDFALLSGGLADETARLKSSGLDVIGPRDGGRLRPDGQRIAWRTLNVQSDPPVRLPFVIEDVTPRQLRVPNGTAAQHPIGVSGVAGITIVVRDLASGVAPFATLLGTEGTSSTPDLEGVEAARRFAFGAQWIELVQPSGENGPLRQYLETRGEGPFEVVLAVEQPAQPLSISTTHGARIRLNA